MVNWVREKFNKPTAKRRKEDLMPNMIVCVKQIDDHEAPPGSFKVDEATKQDRKSVV